MTSLKKGAGPNWGVSLAWIFVAALLVPRASEAALQRFVERPESVSVREGGSVTLRCVVANQQGRVQWTKDGFALGFDRGVPGYPRYMYLGEARLGEHHLRIQGATLTEDGEYQCQVGPTDATPPIWAAANVTVLVPPASVRILGWSSGAVVEVVSGVPVVMECLANEALLARRLTWSRNIEEHVEESSLVERRWDARSRLALTPTPTDDGRRFFCQAAHLALETPLLSFVTLSVLYPPGRPTISGYSPGEALREGETLILTCRASRGKPPPWLVWRRGGRVLDDSSTTTEEEGGGVVNSLEIEVSAADDGAVLACAVNNDLLDEPLRTNVTLNVHYPPTVVRIRGPSQVEDGAPIGLTCETDESKPPAIITWLIQGRQYDSEQTVVTHVSTGGWITTSDLTKYVMRSNQAREVTVQCEATNPSVHGTVTATKVILVTQPASPPVLLVDLQSPLPAGSLLPLACASHGGHPPPTIRIYKEAIEVPTDLIQEGNVTRAEGEVTLTAADNGALISCELVRPGSRSPLIATGRLSVQFAPWEVSASATPPAVPEGSELRLSCTTSSSFPPSVVKWSSGGVALEGAVTITTQGAFGGTTTRSDLRLRVKAADNGRTVRCEADNGVSDPVSSSVTLDVLHRPRWVVRPPPRVNVEEGNELILTAAAAANPGPPR
ncbi:nephrin-like [Penaeus japonicus]|uniref:nephrin-like n=1 Tax=Penaeus japonicus TaxID=27405 RepID=UPI001C716237|nr:nephrin-like [Penaeus japonicus]